MAPKNKAPEKAPPKPKGRQKGAKDKTPRKKRSDHPTKGKRWKRKDAHQWVPTFLQWLAHTGNISESAKNSGCTRGQVNALIQSNEVFAQNFRDAMEDSKDVLLTEIRRRGLKKDGKLLWNLYATLMGFSKKHIHEIYGKEGGAIEIEVLAAEEKRVFLTATITALIGKEDDRQSSPEEVARILEGRPARTVEEDRHGDALHATNGAAAPPDLEPPSGSADKGL